MKCSKCGAEFKRGEGGLKYKGKNYCSLLCAGLGKIVYEPPERKEESEDVRS